MFDNIALICNYYISIITIPSLQSLSVLTLNNKVTMPRISVRHVEIFYYNIRA